MSEENKKPSKKKGLTIKRVFKKIGRNKLCPCGSGKKFKKCCEGNISNEYKIHY